MTLTIESPEASASPTPRGRSRWIMAAAAAAVILLGIGTLILRRDDPAPAEPPDGPPATLPAPASREDGAVTTAEAYLTALYTGDADRAVALTNPDVSNVVADRDIAEMFGATAPSDRPSVVACTATDERAWVLVRCDVIQHHPVFVELGLERMVAPVRVYDDGTIDWLPWEGADFTDANWAVSDYLRLHRPAEYDAECSPGSYEPGSIAADGGLALTGACAELWAPLTDDIARWIRDGKPDPAG